MYNFNPLGRSLPALEKNILKFRAFEMIMILFYVEYIKKYVVQSVQTTDRFRNKIEGREERLPDGTKKLYKKLWQILVDENILTSEERDDIENIIDYRNDIAHSIHELVFDLNPDSYSSSFVEFRGRKYEYGILDRLKSYSENISNSLSKKYICVVSMSRVLFDPAENTYREELSRLSVKIDRQFEQRKIDTYKVENEINNLDRKLIHLLAPNDPANIGSSGKLTSKGIECCYKLFEMGVSNLAVSYLMRLSLKSVNIRKVKWRVNNA